MHATHQFFLTKRSLYLLVLDTRLGEDENRLEYWLKIIQSFGGDSPVIVVGNKCDQQALDLDRRGLQLKYPSIKAFVETSCQTGEGIELLKTAIQQEIDQMAHVKDELPLSWFELKQTLEQLDRDYMPYPEYQQLCQQQNIDDEQDQQLLIGFLHDLGVVLNFRDDPRLEDTNILNPVWVTNGVYQILNDNALMTQHQGVLVRQMLDRILPADRYPKGKHLFVIDMMRKFELCFDRVPDQEFLIPDLLSKEEPYTGDWSDALAFQYHYNVLPGSVISRFIVRASAMIQQKTCWRSGVVLAQDGSRALVKADREDRKIWVRVGGAVTTRRQLLGTIRAHFDHIHRTIIGIVVEAKVPLPDRPEIEVSYSHLLRLERMGETDYIPEGLGERVNVRQLLDGVESAQQRVERWDRRDPKYDFSHATIYGLSMEGRGNAQIAGQTVQHNRAIGTQHNASSESLAQEEVMALLAEIVQLIQQSDPILPAANKGKANKFMAAATAELEEAEPDRQLIAKNLERTAKTLQTASQTVEAGQTLWGQVSPILVKVAGWLGPAAATLWKILT